MDERTAFEEQVTHCEQIAVELETAARHVRTMALHFQEKEVPRSGAHALAAQHALKASA